ncbi:MAG TPA: hypothetical protein VEZ12_04915, partial [Herpetosiphonaceae bacterium]|nr:hypothetical protein [Herpetosiphonaceae bacterium]
MLLKHARLVVADSVENMMPILQRASLLIAVTIAVAVGLVAFAHEVGVQSVFFALFINPFLLVWAVAVQRIFRLSFGEAYYRCRSWEQSGRLYRWLGVLIFKRLMASRLWRAFNPDFRFTGRQGGLTAWKQTTRDAETGHALVFMLVLILTGYIGGRGWVSSAG